MARRCLFHPPSSILHPRSSILTGRATHPWANAHGSPGFARRAAFTIIELLVVITIIAVLMTLVVSVMGAFLTQARDAATKSTLNKIQGLVNSRAQALNRLTMRKGVITTKDPIEIVIGMKQVERRYFPQRVVELSATDQPTMYAAYVFRFSQPPPIGQNMPNPNGVLGGDLTQYDPTKDPNHTLRSSEILYNFLTQANVLGDAPITTDAFSAAEVTDTPEILDPVTKQLVGNGLPEFVDAWGNPLRFYRWPTRLFRSGGVTGGVLQAITARPGPPSNPDGTFDVDNAKMLFSSLPVFSGNLVNDLARDPDDPLRICQNIPNFEFLFHTPSTYHVLLIVSAGPDGQLGLNEPDLAPAIVTDTLTPHGNLAQPLLGRQDDLTDNIMYLNVRAGGK